MQDKDRNMFDRQKLIDYKALETKLYGEMLKLCRFYQNKLSLISILGILALVSQEIKDLDKTIIKDIDDETVDNREPLNRLI
ncbi:MAG TPA: hypothetical protein ENO12_00885 [Thermoplasmatales archaeon]|nr:hypothetical protein [Thermoplasmatales archaeon]